MASENYLEDALNAEVDETAVNVLMKSLQIQLDCSTMQQSNLAESSREVEKCSVNLKRDKDTSNKVQDNLTRRELSTIETHNNSMNNATPVIQERNRSTDLPRNLNSSNVSIASHIKSSNCSAHVISQGQSVAPLKFQDNVKSIYGTGNQISGNRMTFQPGLIQNRNLGHSMLSAQSLLKMTSAMPNVLNVSEAQNASASPVMIQLTNIPGLDHLKNEGRNVMLRSSANTSVTSGPQLLMSVVPVPTTSANAGTSSEPHITTTNSSSTSIPGVSTLHKPNLTTVAVPQTIERTAPAICPPNLQIVNVIPLRPDAPAKQEQKNVPSRVVISTPQMAGNRVNPTNIVPVTAHKGQIAHPSQGHLLLKAQNGQYQWVRVNLATGKPGIAIAPNSKTSATLAPGPSLVSKTVSQDLNNRLSQTSQQTIMSQNAKGQYIVDNTCKEKCHKFLTKILELASLESQAIQKDIRNLIQDLIDAKLEPDYFCRCLEVLLHSKSTHCLVDFLKRSLPVFRIALMTKELVLSGIRPPVYQVGLPPSGPTVIVPQLQSLQQSSHSTQPTSQQQSILIQRQNDTSSLLKNQDLLWQAQMRSQLPPKNNNSTIQLPNHVNLISPANVLAHSSNQQCFGQQLIRQGSTLRSFPTRILQPQPPISISNSIVSPTSTDVIQQFNKRSLPLEVNRINTSSNTTTSLTKKFCENNEGKLNKKDENKDLQDGEHKISQHNSSGESFLNTELLQERINKIALAHGLEESTSEVVQLISLACRQKMKSVLQKLSDIAEHRTVKFYNNVQTDVMHGIQGQLKFLEEVDKLKSKNQDNSDGKLDTSEQARLKAKYKKGLKAEMKELRQQEANQTALQAIGFRKKPKLENGNDGSNLDLMDAKNIFGQNQKRAMGLRRFKRVTVKDLIWFLEQEKHPLTKKLLYKAYNNW